MNNKEINKIAEEKAFDYQRELGMINSVSDDHVIARRMGFYDGFIAGAEWQAGRCDEETSKLLYAERQTAYINGWDDHKEQMLKDAVEGEVIKTDKHTSVRYKSFYGTDRYFYGIADKQFKPGDKVRIIVMKEEE